MLSFITASKFGLGFRTLIFADPLSSEYAAMLRVDAEGEC
jgi:hypothetical protein